jgi:hypothetical protein
MTDKTKRIASLNDLCRTAMGVAGRLVVTQGIASLPRADQSAIVEKVQKFEDFSADNNPYGERDFGAFDHAGRKVFWKIDYYDPTFSQGSEDPADPKKTARVLTILLAEEW